MTKKQVNIRASDQTREQLEKLTQWWGTSVTETIALVIDRTYQQEKQKHVKSVPISFIGKDNTRIPDK